MHGTTPRFVNYDVAPVISGRVQPTYLETARRLGIQGTVILDIEIFANGSIGSIEVWESVQSGPGGLDEECIRAVRQWVVQPATANGVPVAIWLRQPFAFRL